MKKCMNCQSILDDKIKFCPTCGTSVVKATNSLPHEQLIHKEPVMVRKNNNNSNPPKEKNKFTKKMIAITSILCVCAVITIALVFLIIGKNGNSKSGLFYLRNGKIEYISSNGKEANMIVSNYEKNLFSKDYTGYTNEESVLSWMNTTTYLDSKYIYYLSNINTHGFEYFSADIMYKNIKKESKEPEKLVTISWSGSYSTNDGPGRGNSYGTYPYIFIKNEKDSFIYYKKDSNLYKTTIKDGTKIISDIDYFYQLNDEKILISMNNGEVKLLNLLDDSIETIINTGSELLYVNDDYSMVYYYKDEVLYCYNDGTISKPLIDADLTNNRLVKFCDDGTIYYSITKDNTLNISDYITDEYKQSDAAIKEPQYDDYTTESFDQVAYDEFKSYYNTLTNNYYDNNNYYDDLMDYLYYADYYEHLYDFYEYDYEPEYGNFDNYLKYICTNLTHDDYAYNEAYDKYQITRERNYYRDQIQNYDKEAQSYTTYDLYYYDGSSTKLVAQNIGTFFSENIPGDYLSEGELPKNVISYSEYNTKPEKLYDISTLSDVDIEDLVDSILNTALENSEFYLVSGSNAPQKIELENKNNSHIYLSSNGNKAYVYNYDDYSSEYDNDTWYIIDLTKENLVAKKIDDEIYGSLMYYEGKNYYLKNVDYSGLGELFSDSVKIKGNISPEHTMYIAKVSDSIKVAFFQEDNYYDSTYEMVIIENETITATIENVAVAYFEGEDTIYYIKSSGNLYETGDLYQYKDGKNIKYASDVLNGVRTNNKVFFKQINNFYDYY